jgi:hypothetical protein
MTNRSAWLAERRKYVGGSDIAAIMGLDTWGKTAYDVACDKLGLRPDSESTPQQAIGKAIEGTIGKLYEAEHVPPGHRLFLHSEDVVKSQELGWVAGSADGHVSAETSPGMFEPVWGVEFKNIGGFARWWPKQETVPLHVEMQCNWYMMVTRLDRWDVAALVRGNTFCIYQLTADFWMQFVMLTAADEFWRGHVLTETLPEPVTLDNALDAIKRLTPTGAVRWCNAEEEARATEYFDAETVYDFAKQKLDAAKTKVIIAIGADAGMEGPDWKITTKTANGKPRFSAERTQETT